MKIGFFDSGFGGISILKESLKINEDVNYLYLADNLNVPYGEKDKEVLKEIIDNNIQLLIKNNCDIIVIACNTATSISIKDLRLKYDIPIIGTEPAIKPAIEYYNNMNDRKNKKILLTATKLTLKEKKLADLISSFDNFNIVKQELSKLVVLAESGNYTKQDVYDYLSEVIDNKEEYCSIVLGCTHFPLFKEEILEFFGNDIKIFDSSFGVCKNIQKTILNVKQSDKNIVENESNKEVVELILTKENDGYRTLFYNILNHLK